MIEYIPGNIFTSGADAIVVPCTLDGIMGGGLIQQVRDRWPQIMFTRYREDCAMRDLKIGKGRLYYLGHLSTPKYLLMFPTREKFTSPSKLQFISEGLYWLSRTVENSDINSVAIPGIGCGLGGLRWDDVEEMILRAFWKSDRDVMVYLPMTEIAEWADTLIIQPGGEA